MYWVSWIRWCRSYRNVISSIGIPELVLILVIALVVFGPGKLPEIGKAVGKSLREFRSASKEDNTKTIDAKNEDEKKDKK